MKNSPQSVKEDVSRRPGGQYHADKKRLFRAALLIVVIIAALWLFNWLQISRIRKKYDKQAIELAQKSHYEIVERSKDFLKLIAEAYALMAKNSLAHGKPGQINLRGAEITSHKGFISVMAINPNGRIISSTSKTFKNSDFVSINHPYYLEVDSTIVNAISDSLWVIASPVQDGTQRLGTVIVNYSPYESELSPANGNNPAGQQ